jgi:hypothetical protein
LVTDQLILSILSLKDWLDLVSGFALLIGGVIAGLWAYIKFVVERGILPPIEFYIECKKVGEQKEKKILDIGLRIKNNGSSTLVARDIRVDIRYINENDKIEYRNGKLNFPNSLIQKSDSERRGIEVMKYDSFVQSTINQRYSFITFVPKSATFILVWSSFRYAQKPSRLQRILLYISRKLGLIQYSLTHATAPHTAEHIFRV